MTDSLDEGPIGLYKQLLKLVDKEKQALVADNLGELEACVRLKEQIVKKLRALESKKGQDGPSDYGEEVVRLLEQVTTRHERVRESIEAMLGECQQAILEIRNGQRAHQAYYRARKKARELSTRLL